MHKSLIKCLGGPVTSPVFKLRQLKEVVEEEVVWGFNLRLIRGHEQQSEPLKLLNDTWVQSVLSAESSDLYQDKCQVLISGTVSCQLFITCWHGWHAELLQCRRECTLLIQLLRVYSYSLHWQCHLPALNWMDFDIFTHFLSRIKVTVHFLRNIQEFGIYTFFMKLVFLQSEAKNVVTKGSYSPKTFSFNSKSYFFLSLSEPTKWNAMYQWAKCKVTF